MQDILYLACGNITRSRLYEVHKCTETAPVILVDAGAGIVY